MRTCGKGLLLLTVMIVQVHWTATESVMVVMFILHVGCCVAPYQWTFQVQKKVSNEVCIIIYDVWMGKSGKYQGVNDKVQSN